MNIVVIARGLPTKEDSMNGIFEWDQAKALSRFGHKVIYVALDCRSFRHKRELGLSHQNIDGVEVFNYNIYLGRVPMFLRDALCLKAFDRILKNILKTTKIDIIHAHFARTLGVEALYAKQKYGIDYIVTEHESIVNNNLVSKAEREQLYEIYGNAKDCIAVSPTFCNKLKKMYNVIFNYVPNIVDYEVFAQVEKQKHEGVNIVSVGNLTKNKSMDVAIRAFSKVKECCNIGTFTIIGNGSEKEQLKQLAQEFNVADSIVFTGNLSRAKIAQHYAKSDIFVLASKSETFGVAYIEAMCAGLPVIATKCGGPEGLFTENEGLYVDVDDVDGLANAIMYIAKNLDNYDANSIRNFCLSNFSAEIVAKQITEIINR